MSWSLCWSDLLSFSWSWRHLRSFLRCRCLINWFRFWCFSRRLCWVSNSSWPIGWSLSFVRCWRLNLLLLWLLQGNLLGTLWLLFGPISLLLLPILLFLEDMFTFSSGRLNGCFRIHKRRLIRHILHFNNRVFMLGLILFSFRWRSIGLLDLFVSGGHLGGLCDLLVLLVISFLGLIIPLFLSILFGLLRTSLFSLRLVARGIVFFLLLFSLV